MQPARRRKEKSEGRSGDTSCPIMRARSCEVLPMATPAGQPSVTSSLLVSPVPADNPQHVPQTPKSYEKRGDRPVSAISDGNNAHVEFSGQKIITKAIPPMTMTTNARISTGSPMPI